MMAPLISGRWPIGDSYSLGMLEGFFSKARETLEAMRLAATNARGHPERSEGSPTNSLITLCRLCDRNFDREIPRFARDDKGEWSFIYFPNLRRRYFAVSPE